MEKEEILNLDLPLKYLYPFVKKEKDVVNGIEFTYDVVDVFLCKNMVNMFVRQLDTVPVFKLTCQDVIMSNLGCVYNANIVPVPRYNEKGYVNKLRIDVGGGAKYWAEYYRDLGCVPKSIEEISSSKEKHNYNETEFKNPIINVKVLNNKIKVINFANYEKAKNDAIEEKRQEDAFFNVDKFYSELN